ncbi:unnamed protein product [Rotaria socialis]|uniref:Uncharacterized protein n=2 Tax=Rotaria socialis TaxID=392032 RepID=A0A818HN60_9BILA|nr:unnamed protein product [Rotaria socialis]CAF3469108.1 unnamed protein product [Rotaria socialis]CAF3511382.1 unnamed protein product [Rotaria socialis]CAF3619281.1 unnamed protein product [Rotaria socialis]
MAINRDTLLRISVSIHFFCISMVLMAEWLPKSYLFNQVTILALGLWAIVHRESVIQVELLILIKFFSIILDSIAIGMYFQIGNQSYSVGVHYVYFVISAVFAIGYLILKPVMILLLNKVREDRLNNAAFGMWTPASGYMPVDGH